MAYKAPRSITGNNLINWMSDSYGNDKIYAYGGSDRITVSYGFDQIWAGSGNDTLRLKGHFYDYQAYKLSDGALVLYSKEYGLKIAYDVECVDFYHKGPLGIAEYTDRYKVSGDRLTDKALFTNNDMFYLSKTEGTAGADNLTGTVLFGMGGNDVLTAHASRDSLLYGGDGNDLLTAGAAGNDGLYGGAGNDTLVSGSGGDLMNGGEGNDTFIFSEDSKGHVTVEDFNQFLGEADRMIFNGQFDDIDDFAAHLTQSNLNVIVDAGDLTITINDITIRQLLDSDLIFT